jgi:predicted transcriptional regulator
MSFFDEIKNLLNKSNKKLNEEERDTLLNWINHIDNSQLTTEQIKAFISDIKNAIIKDLVEIPEYDKFLFFSIPNRKHLFAKARLKNIIMLEDMLFATDRVKSALENYLKNFMK